MPDCQLSVCIPTYNRLAELKRLFNSAVIPNGFNVEFVVVDDGSTDGTKEFLDQLSHLNIKYYYQENSGRSFALKKAFSISSGLFAMPMDSDDYFTVDAFFIIKKCIEMYSSGAFDSSFCGFSFLCLDESEAIIGDPFPSDGYISNFISIRADCNIRGDKKEVVLSSVLNSCMYEIASKERRVPTSLLWSAIAEKHDVCFINKPVVVKEYLAGGISNNIKKIKKSNPLSMIELNYRLFKSNSYRSKRYRALAALKYYIYCFVAFKRPRFLGLHSFLIAPALVFFLLGKY